MINHKFIVKFELFIFLLSFPIVNTYANQELNLDHNGYLLNGYDPLSYFQQKPLKGNRNLSFKYKGELVLFSSSKNLEMFRNNPILYMPKFGGYCSYGVRMGKKLDIDPNAFAIVDDKLYLLLNQSTKLLWEKDRNKNIAIANRIWPSIKSIPKENLN